jgi:G3E family GTPase
MIRAAVVGGYLGTGKTSLVNHVLRKAGGRRIAVLVNDFGALSIDADLIEAREGDLISIAGGCICCSFGSDLMEALAKLAARTPVVDHVLIETSGLSLPRVVGQSAALLPGYQNAGVVVVADASSVRNRAADPYTGDTVLRQLSEAHLVVVNKLDLLADGETDAVREWVWRMAPQAVRIECIGAKVPVELLPGFGSTGFDPIRRGLTTRPGNAAALFQSEAFVQSTAVDVERLARSLADQVPGLLRAKAVLEDVDGSVKTMHLVDGRWGVEPFASTRQPRRALVCIGVRGTLERAAIVRLLEETTAPASTPH